MWSNINRLFGKIFKQFHDPTLLYRGINYHQFPSKPIRRLQIAARLYGLKRELEGRHIDNNLGSLYTPPDRYASDVYRHFIKYNPGNLGTWSDNRSLTSTTKTIEYEVIHKLIDLYRGDHHKLSGYITSGGTEGNIFTLWLASSFLEQYCRRNKICLLKTNLTHYSITKAAKLCDLSQFILPLNKKNWNIDIYGFRNTVHKLSRRGYKGFIIPLTIGYTSTGTSDNIDEVCREVNKIKKENKGITFFIWIDAALNGLIAPFYKQDFRPFNSPNVQALIVDFHKFGLAPYPAGVILYKKGLLKTIESTIDYLLEKDTTLIGSRSGIPAINIWVLIHSFGKSGYLGLINDQAANKEYLVEQIKLINQKIEIITHPDSLSCGLIFKNFKNHRLPEWIEDKYGLYPGKTKLVFYPDLRKTEIIYKLFFLPHVKKTTIINFINDINRVS